MKCPHCDGTGEIPDPNAKPPSKGSEIFGAILTFIALGFLLFCLFGLMRDCGRMHLGGGMCGLIGLEAVVPIGAMWLLRKGKQ